ncbi:hypothetical protein [Actinomadura sp. 9N215]|uniref:hypothetical protein n=1 Tax=Actinomadura sp. 9N215 TaxID=3375150 RepID=UPI0037BCB7BC
MTAAEQSVSEQTAWRIYAGLSADDRRVVDTWRELGDVDLTTALLRSRVLTSGHRRRPADDLADWSRRRLGLDDDLTLRNTCEHEAAHAVVARALGVKVAEVTVSEDGHSGSTVFEQAPPVASAVIAAAAEVWITEFRALVFPFNERGFSEDRKSLVRHTGGSDWAARRACRHARDILDGSRAEVLALADELARTRRVVFGG